MEFDWTPRQITLHERKKDFMLASLADDWIERSQPYTGVEYVTTFELHT